MERQFEHQLVTVAALIQQMGGLVEQAIGRSVQALVDRDELLARSVIANDEIIDRMELQVDQQLMQILARYQLAARDLRFVATAMKITPDLERMADLAANISERVIDLFDEPPSRPLVDIPEMARQAQKMVHEALDAFVARDADAARAVIAMDDELDRRMDSVFRELLSHMLDEPKSVSRSLRMTFVAKAFERIGDQATNVCEQVVYMVEGLVIKHGASADGGPDGNGSGGA